MERGTKVFIGVVVVLIAVMFFSPSKTGMSVWSGSCNEQRDCGTDQVCSANRCFGLAGAPCEEDTDCFGSCINERCYRSTGLGTFEAPCNRGQCEDGLECVRPAFRGDNIGMCKYMDCYDSDKGRNYGVKGDVVLKGKDRSSDYCADEMRLKEFFCAEGSAGSEFHRCGDREYCQDGACVSVLRRTPKKDLSTSFKKQTSGSGISRSVGNNYMPRRSYSYERDNL